MTIPIAISTNLFFSTYLFGNKVENANTNSLDRKSVV